MSNSFAKSSKATEGQHTDAQTLARNMAKAAATKSLLIFVNSYLRREPGAIVELLRMI